MLKQHDTSWCHNDGRWWCLAGGCTIGAGLAGLPSLALATILVTVSIILGGLACKYALVSTAFLNITPDH